LIEQSLLVLSPHSVWLSLQLRRCKVIGENVAPIGKNRPKLRFTLFDTFWPTP